MQLLIIAGFLGSGKTTLLSHLARSLVESKKKVAIIENEVGRVGIDDLLLKDQGLQVREIYSGCVCCSLRYDLITTLLQLEREVSPDIVILEPSGVAGPKQVRQAFHGYGGEISSTRVITVFDAQRFLSIKNLSIPIITDGIEAADIIVVNKIDLVSEPQLSHVVSHIRAFRPDANIITASVNEISGAANLVSKIASLLESKSPLLPLMSQAHADVPSPSPSATVFAFEHGVWISPIVTGDDIRQKLSQLVHEISTDCSNSGTTLIGHIKAILKVPRGGYLVASSTSPAQLPQLKGSLPHGIDSAKLTLNAIVYGIENERLASLARPRLQDFLDSLA